MLTGSSSIRVRQRIHLERFQKWMRLILGDETSVLCEAQSPSLPPSFPSLVPAPRCPPPLPLWPPWHLFPAGDPDLQQEPPGIRGKEGQGQAWQPCPEGHGGPSSDVPASLQPALPPASCRTVSSLPLLCSTALCARLVYSHTEHIVFDILTSASPTALSAHIP